MVCHGKNLCAPQLSMYLGKAVWSQLWPGSGMGLLWVSVSAAAAAGAAGASAVAPPGCSVGIAGIAGEWSLGTNPSGPGTGQLGHKETVPPCHIWAAGNLQEEPQGSEGGSMMGNQA